MNDLKELLAHIDQPTRAEIIRRCAHYEREIKHLKEQYRQLQEVSPQEESKTIREIVTRAKADINGALARTGRCTVFYSPLIKRFKIVTQEARISVEQRRSELVGIYTRGLDKSELTEDLFTALEGG